MTSLDRAKRFLASKATKLALTIVPLAALTVSTPAAKASGTFSSGSCSVIQGAGVCQLQQAGLEGGDSGFNWLEVFTTSAASPSGSNTVELKATGSASGTFGTNEVLPLSWDFFVSSSGGSGAFTWNLVDQLTFTAGGPIALNVGNSGSFNQEINGSSSVTNLGDPLTLAGYSIDLTVTGSNSNFFVNIPGASTLDLNPAQQSATPEPTTMILTGGALVGAALLSRRRKKNKS